MKEKLSDFERAKRQAARTKIWKQKNRDRVNAQKRQHWQKNRAKNLSKQRERYRKNREYFVSRSAEYRKRHPEKVREQIKRYSESICQIKDCYIRNVLRMKILECPKELIEAKRAQIKLLRLVRELKQQTT